MTRATVTLMDGTDVVVRAMTTSDATRLVRFHETLSSETARLRFFNHHPHLTDREVDRFTGVNHVQREALVAVVGDDIVGVGRYDRLPGSDAAEVAFVVADQWQGRGIGTALFGLLADAARANGIRRFVADTLYENRKMLELFQHTGLVTGQSFERGVVEVEMELQQLPAMSSGP